MKTESDKNKKAAIQISMGFVVMLVIAISIFILSLIFLGDFFTEVNKMKLVLDEQTEGKINSMIAGNARVAIPFERKNTKQGEGVVYGIGIRNTLSNESFVVELATNSGRFIPINEPSNSYSLYCNADYCQIGDGYNRQGYQSGDDALFYQIGRGGKLKIEMNEDDKVLFGVQPMRKAPLGHYILNIEICSGPGSAPPNCVPGTYYDGSIHKIHLIVK